MPTSVPRDLLRTVWEYPLLEALFGRRTRRFALGFEMTQGPYRYRSPQAPVPLCENEEALLVAAGFGLFRNGAVGSEPAAAVPEQRWSNLPEHLARSPHGAVFDKRPRRVRHRPGCGLSGSDAGGRRPRWMGGGALPLRSPPFNFATAPARHSASRAATLRAQFVGLEHARIDAVHADLRCHLFADRADRAICRSQARTLRARERTWHQHRRRSVRVSAGRHRGLDHERISMSRQHAGVEPPGASGLLLHVQRAGGDLPEHVSCDRGDRPRRLDALRDPVAGNIRGARLHDRRAATRTGAGEPCRPRSGLSSLLSTLFREHGRGRRRGAQAAVAKAIDTRSCGWFPSAIPDFR